MESINTVHFFRPHFHAKSTPGRLGHSYPHVYPCIYAHYYQSHSSQVLLSPSVFNRNVSASPGNAFANAGPKLQFSSLLKCLSKTGLIINSSLSGLPNNASVGSYGQFKLNVVVKGIKKLS